MSAKLCYTNTDVENSVSMYIKHHAAFGGGKYKEEFF